MNSLRHLETLDRVRKIKFEGVQAIVCGKLKEAPPEFAVGYTTGQIRILELNNQNTRKAEFAAGKTNKSFKLVCVNIETFPFRSQKQSQCRFARLQQLWSLLI